MEENIVEAIGENHFTNKEDKEHMKEEIPTILSKDLIEHIDKEKVNSKNSIFFLSFCSKMIVHVINTHYAIY